MASNAVKNHKKPSFLSRRFKEEMDALWAGKVVPLIVDDPEETYWTHISRPVIVSSQLSFFWSFVCTVTDKASKNANRSFRIKIKI